MKLATALVCLLLSSVYAAPAPQDFEEEEEAEQFAFDEDSLNQQGNLTPQGFTQQVQDQDQEPQQQQENVVRTSSQSVVANNGATVLRYIYDFTDVGYKFTYELSDGTIRSEEGAFKESVDDQGNESKVLVVQGAYSFIGDDGETYWTNYKSDEKGYRPVSGKGVGGIKPGDEESIDPNLLKSLVG